VLAADSRQIKRLKIKRLKQRPPRPAPKAGDGPTQAAAE
jgi:hypothetical protein